MYVHTRHTYTPYTLHPTPYTYIHTPATDMHKVCCIPILSAMLRKRSTMLTVIMAAAAVDSMKAVTGTSMAVFPRISRHRSPPTPEYAYVSDCQHHHISFEYNIALLLESFGMHSHLLTARRSSSRGEAARRRDPPTQVAWPAMHDGAGLRTPRLSLGMMLMLPGTAHPAIETRAQEKSATSLARSLESLSFASQRRFVSRWRRKIVTLTTFSHYACQEVVILMTHITTSWQAGQVLAERPTEFRIRPLL